MRLKHRMIVKLIMNIWMICMQDVYKNIEDYNPGKELKVLIIFGDLIPETADKKKLWKVFEKQLKNRQKRLKNKPRKKCWYIIKLE